MGGYDFKEKCCLVLEDISMKNCRSLYVCICVFGIFYFCDELDNFNIVFVFEDERIG